MTGRMFLMHQRRPVTDATKVTARPTLPWYVHFVVVLVALLMVLILGVAGSTAVAFAAPRGRTPIIDAPGLRWRIDHVSRGYWALCVSLFSVGLLAIGIWTLAVMAIRFNEGIDATSTLLYPLAFSVLPPLVLAVRRHHTHLEASTTGLRLRSRWRETVEFDWAQTLEVSVEDDALAIRTEDGKIALFAAVEKDELRDVARWLETTRVNELRAPAVVDEPPPADLRSVMARSRVTE